MTTIAEKIDDGMQQKNANPRDFFTPRDYQLELLDSALDHNCIVSLGTGFGKTYVAILLIKEYSDLLIQNKMKVFFVVDKVTLAVQQKNQVELHTNLSIGLMHGQMNSALWEDKAIFDKFYNENEVFVTTHAILNQLLNSVFVKWSEMALLIVDECHHVLGLNHEYRKLMNYYREQKDKSQRPRVLGLTATVVNSKAKFEKIEDMIRDLEILMCSRLETASSAANLAKYGPKPFELIIDYKDSQTTFKNCATLLTEAREQIREFKFVKNKHENDDLFNSIKDCTQKAQSALETLGPWACYKICHLYADQYKKMKLTCVGNKPRERLIVYSITVFQQCLAQLEHLSRWQKNQEDLKAYATEKVHRIVEILFSFHSRIVKEKPISSIIFVRERHIAFLLSAFLNRLAYTHDPKYKFIKADYVIGRQGFTVTNTEELMVANKRQELTISKFRSGTLNVLVSTSVLEEGIDVKSCNCVIRTFPPEDFRAYIQSRGRARAPNAIYCLLCPDNESESLNERLQQFNAIEQLLTSRFTTANYAINTNTPLPDTFPPYCVESTGARVSLSTAVALINRYCAKLPSDVFTRLVPEVRDIPIQLNGNICYKAELLLPINAPIKCPIRLEEPVYSRSLARMAVALKACEVLHKGKELTDHLLPAGKDSIAQDFLNEVVEDDEYMTGVAVRNIKKRRLYDRKVTKTLTKALAQVGQQCWLYIIDIHLIEPLSAEENLKKRRIIDPHNDVTAFGFICTNELPSITRFPVFLRQGKTEISFVKAATRLTIDQDTMNLIYEFHAHIFEDILRVAKNAVAFSPENAHVPLLIVPLIKKIGEDGRVFDAELDRSRLLPNIRRIEPVPNLDQRKEYKFQEEKFRDAVVLPWYRVTDHPTYYYVAEICRNDHPASTFPDEKYKSFNEYFISKYELEIYDQEQPLLDVDRASERMNLILPRAPSARAKKQSFDPTQRQILIPELVHIHPLSATYWTSIIALPTILYRLNQFLLIDELRSTIVHDAFKRDPKAPINVEWPKLDYETPNTNPTDKSIRNITQLRQNQPEIQQAPVDNWDDSLADDSMEVDESQHTFDVGYWDPNEAMDFQTLRSDPLNLSGSVAAVADKIGEQAALGQNGDDNMSDGEIEEYEIITEYSDLRRRIGEDNLDSSSFDLANALGGPIGWDSNSFLPHIETSVPDQNGLISITGVDGIDLRGLMVDLQNELSNLGNTPPTTSASSHSPVKQKKLDRPTAVDIPSRREGNSRAIEEFVDAKLIEMTVEGMPPTPESFEDEIKQNTVAPTELSKLTSNEDLDWLVNGTFEVKAPIVKGSFKFQDDQANEDKEEYGVPPSLLLQALTTASASDGMNLERLETIGDSFLKLAVTNYLYSEYAVQHEGKLSYARSKEVSNTNLFKIGKNKNLPSIMESSKFDPNVSWLPPGYVSTAEFHAQNWLNPDEELEKIRNDAENADKQKTPKTGWDQEEEQPLKIENGVETINLAKASKNPELPIPYNTMTQQCINDKAIADAVEALIGAHLISLGLNSTLKFMDWLGIKVLMEQKMPVSPLLQFMDSEEDTNASKRQLHTFYIKHRFELLEDKIGYRFGNKAFLVQAFTHASYYKGRVTGCYQRLEFLGDAVLDYLVTRFLFEHKGRFAPGILTDLRSALVNNTIFASLAVKHGLHKFFLSLSSTLAQKIDTFVEICEIKNQTVSSNGASDCPNFNSELFMVTEEEIESGHEEDIEVPKALGDIFESLAGAIFLDSGMNLDVVWRVYYNLMKETIEECCRNPPLSPVRELFELKGSNARFAKLERVIETNKIRVTVEIDDNLRFEGTGRSFRLAKATAAKRALKYLHSLEAQRRSNALRI